MTKLFSLSLALITSILFFDSVVQAQIFDQGYQFGAGLQAAGYGNFGGFRSIPREQPPYFAQFPPVYYSRIVPRPYGISPYAAPAGIMPVEMSVPMPCPTIISNPHVIPATPAEPLPPVHKENTDSEDMTNESASIRKTGKSSGWVKNPHFADEQAVVNK
jgi:hypothetical protein